MKIYLFSLALLCLMPACSFQKNDEEKPHKFTILLQDYMKSQVEVNHFSGTVLVMKNGIPLLRKAYGLADREWNVPNTIDTKYRIASITKWFTAAAILKLEEMGKLNVNDKLSNYFPRYPKGDSVTLHMILTHTSGIADCFHLDSIHNARFSRFALGDNGEGMKFSFPKDSILSVLKSAPYDFSPGTNVSYSNGGYLLLGMIIEKVSGMTYEEFLAEKLFKVADMQDSGFGRYNTILKHRARGYQQNDNGYRNAFNDEYRSDQMFSIGSIYTTVDDLYKWDRALAGTAVLNEASKKKMFAPGIFKRGEDQWGYGCSIDSLQGHKRIGMRGWVMGFKSVVYRFPEDNICIVVLSNNELRPAPIANCLFSIVNGYPIMMPYVHKEQKTVPGKLSNYTGIYNYKVRDPFMNSMEVIKKGNSLYRVSPVGGYDTLLLIPESENKFFYGDGSDRQMQFVTHNGRTDSLYIINSGFIYEFVKSK